MLAMFHLFTHAFFKALTFFMCWFSYTLHLHHEQDINETMAALRKKLPLHFFAFMIIGTVAITGVGIPFSYDIFHLPVGFAGFVSKDAIIEGTYAVSQGKCIWDIMPSGPWNY